MAHVNDLSEGCCLFSLGLLAFFARTAPPSSPMPLGLLSLKGVRLFSFLQFLLSATQWQWCSQLCASQQLEKTSQIPWALPEAASPAHELLLF